MVILDKNQAELFEDIRFVRYGELCNVECIPVGEDCAKELSQREKLFLKILRDHTYFYSIGIHAGEPSYAIIGGKSIFGNDFRRRIKFV
jgi:hypothetical protein